MEWNAGPKYTAYLNAISDLLTDERRTVRDVYYALEATGFPDDLRRQSYDHAVERHRADPDENPHPDDVPTSEWAWEFKYRYVKRAVKKGRRAGYIDPSLIVDTSRVTANYSDGGDDPPTDYADRIADMPDDYFEDPWDDQPTHVEVWLEKQSLASVFRPICDDKNVRLEATRGDWSDSKVYEAAQRLIKRLRDGDRVRILYFGDFNPSGLHAPVAIQKTMQHYGLPVRPGDAGGDADYFDIWPFFLEHEPNEGARTFNDVPGNIKFERLALTLDQVKDYDLPENPTPSSTDKDRQLRERFEDHASDGRDVNIELNALKEYHRDDLEDLIRDGIEEHIDGVKWAGTESRVDRRRELLNEAVDVDKTDLPDGGD